MLQGGCKSTRMTKVRIHGGMKALQQEKQARGFILFSRDLEKEAHQAAQIADNFLTAKFWFAIDAIHKRDGNLKKNIKK